MHIQIIDMDKNNIAISATDIVKYRETSHLTAHEQVISHSIMTNGLEKVAFNNKLKSGLPQTFSVELETGKVTSQERSGRCWMFAGLNLMRREVAKKLNLKDFELSQNYLMFFDKLEKANYFLEGIIRTSSEDVYSRIVMWLLRDPLQDGGQWEMFTNLVEKYGVVPKYVMPETYHSGNSYFMNQVLTGRLREYARDIRRAAAKGGTIEQLKLLKANNLEEFYRLLVMFLGTPPEKFDFEIKNEDKEFHADYAITPHGFMEKYIESDLLDYVSIINAPVDDKPFGKTYTVDYLGNVIEGRKVLYLNVDNKPLKKLTIDQLADGQSVWFGCDVRLQTERKMGIMDSRTFLVDEALNFSSNFSKGDRLQMGESMLTHAMVFTGVHMVDQKPVRWKVENSWGESRGEKGYFVMSDNWFDQYNYQVVIHKKHLTSRQHEILATEPIVLPPWDPMGSLARMT